MGADSRIRLAVGLCITGLLVAALFSALASAQPPSASKPTTQFQCEKKYKLASDRTRCFNQLPGSSCAHPLEVQKTYPNYRGDTKDFTVTLQQEPDGIETLLLSYTYAPKKNVAICPGGVVFKIGPQYRPRPGGEEEQAPAGYEEKNHPEPTTRTGGEFSYVLTNHPVKTWYLSVKGYYIHPAWEHHAQAAVAHSQVAPAHKATAPTTTAQCKKRYKAGTKSRSACIKRVNKPGASCAHPLESAQTAYGPVGDKADFTVELGQYENEALPFTPVQINAIVTLHSSRVAICPQIKIVDEHPGSFGTPPHYYATVGPEGGTSSTITVPFGIFHPTAYARLK